MAIILNRKKEEQRLQHQYDRCTKWLRHVGAVKDYPDGLMKLYHAHVEMWRDGIRNKNLGPDQYGMFRTGDIATMYPFQVYLGDVDGLFTNDVDFFEKDKEKHLASLRREGKEPSLPEHYVRVCRQYRDHLMSNILDIRNNIFDKGVSRDVLAEHVAEACNLLAEHQGGDRGVSGLEFTCSSLAENRILECKMRYRGLPVTSSLLNVKGRFLIPQGFERGVQITPKNVTDMKYRDVFDVLLCLKDDGKEQPKLLDLSGSATQKIGKASKLLEPMSRKEIRENRRNQEMRRQNGYRFGI